MNLVENIKVFFKEKGLNWTGKIATVKDKDFRLAEEQDFETLQDINFLVSFDKDGEIAITCEIDLITFKINYETSDIYYSCYAGDNKENANLIEKLEDSDFSKEWISLQLKSGGLLYAMALRNKCQELRMNVDEEKGRRVGQLRRKIGYLNSKIQKTEDKAFEQIKQINEFEKLADKFEIDNSQN